jgi:hypothetical protein
MIKNLALGTVLGAIILFVWSAIAWMFIPWPGQPMRSFTNEQAVVDAMKANAPQSGNYLVPNEPKRTAGMTDEQYNAAMKAAEDRMNTGPMIFAAVRLEPVSMARAMIMGFIIDLLAVLVGCNLLLQTDRLSYKGRVLFVAALGFLIFAAAHLNDANWWGFSTAYTMMQLGAVFIGWLLAGLVMAKFVRGKTAV